MAYRPSLKPFPFTYLDLQFMKDQIDFRPLFDVDGNPIISWSGLGAIYDGDGNQIWDGTGKTAAQAMIDYGISFPTYTSSAGLRDIDGLHNNLFNATWGNTDLPFLQRTEVIFDNYIKPLADGDPNAFYALKFSVSPNPAGADYTKIGDDLTTEGVNEAHSAQNVIDYTPRMISRTITTADVTFETELNSNHLIKDANGYTQVADYGTLETLGQQDGQRAVEINGDIGPNGFEANDINGAALDNQEYFVGAVNPGVAPVNGWFALFGQFFDHGLDFVGKGADGTKITINLAPDDPMYGVIDPSSGQPATKIVISRADVSGFAEDGTPEWNNHTSPFIDQSQTYGSHEQLTDLLREWVLVDPANENSGYRMGAEMFDGQTSVIYKDAFGVDTNATLPTLNELRQHLIDTGRDDLIWEDVLNLRDRDDSGHVIDHDPLADGIQSSGSGAALLLDMNPRFDNLRFENSLNPDAGAAFLADVATLDEAAGTVGGTFSYNGSTIVLTVPAGVLEVGAPAATLTGASALTLWFNFGTSSIKSMEGQPGIDDQLAMDIHDAVSDLLMASVGDHYIAGDGRTNENIGLTAVHHVFHEEHNFQVANLKLSIGALDVREGVLDQTDNYDHSLLHGWQIDTGQQDGDGNFVYSDGTTVAWNDEMLFNAAKMTVEMEYQHTAVDQFARTITPNLHEFVGYNSGENSTISLDFAQVAYRFGHSTLRESIDLMDPDGAITDHVMRVALERAFLSPEKFAAVGAGAIALGMTHQQANEIDEFLTPALNQGLLGQPLDLATINIARGRDLGVPTLNDMREALQLTKYTSWSDFGDSMLHPGSLKSFIAAYAFDGNVARAEAILGLADETIIEGSDEAMGYTAEDALNFLSAPSETLYGSLAFNQIDCWIGGLAEVHITGGLLGETFDTIFVEQLGRLMDGDRFYYLQRLNNIPYGQEIIDEQFKDLIERTTGIEHLNGSAFAYADQYYEFDGQEVANAKTEHKYGDALALHPTLGVYSDGGATTSLNGGLVTVGGIQYIRDVRAESAATKAEDPSGFALDGEPNSGADSNEVIVGTNRNDLIFARGMDDTVYGEDGDDILNGGNGIDRLYGGAGSDVIFGGDGGDLIDGGVGDDLLWGEQNATAAAGLDQLIGSDGNDYIDGGIGIDKLSGSAGDDVIFGGQDTDAFTHGGEGNDYIDGGIVGDLLWGDNGDDLMVGAADQDIVAGMQGDDILRPGPLSQSLTGGGDEVVGGDGVDDSGNDGKGIGFDILDLSDWQAAPQGATFDFANQNNPLPAIDGAPQFPAVAQIEGVIGTRNNDSFVGDGNNNWLIGGSGSDSLTGGIGNDLIIGDGIRLDTVIGTYASSYDLFFDGASHRAFGYADADETTGLERNFIQSNGLLDAMGWDGDKHFTEMLKSAMFKDLELGGSEIKDLWRNGAPQATGESHGTMGDGGVAGSNDVAVFSGIESEYVRTWVLYDLATHTLVDDPSATTIQVLKITDTVADRDGEDLVVGVEKLRFSNGSGGTIDFTLNYAPVITSNGGGAVATLSINENTTGITSVVATDPDIGQTLSYSIVGGADAAMFAVNPTTGVLTLVNTPNYEAPTDAGGDRTYSVIVQVSDGISVDKQTLTVTVLNVDEAATGSVQIISAVPDAGGATATLTAASTVSDPDGMSGLVATQWQSWTGSTWVDASTNAAYVADNGTFRIVTTYSDASFGPERVVSEQTAVVGTSGANTQSGTAGAELMLGLNGNDTYYVNNGGDVVIEAAGGGTDTVYASLSYTLTAEVEYLRANSGSNLALTGNAGDNFIYGGAGNDTLDGGGGKDELRGGLGDDIYVVDSSNDFVSEASAAGTDTVLSSLTWTLGGYLENLTLTGPASINGNGNSLANTIIGNGANNVLNGAAGSDTMLGGAGDDTFYVDSSADVVGEAAGEGNDTVYAKVSYTIGAEIEILRANSSSGIILTGNSGDNLIYGGAGNDTLDGGGGRDELRGGGGNDTYIVDSSNDLVSEAAGAGTDTVQSSLTWTLGGNLEHLTLTGAGAINGTGNSLDNTITGNGADNILNGAAGNDTLYGGAGADRLIGGTGTDKFLYTAELDSVVGASDTITDFGAGDQIDLHALDGLIGNVPFALDTAGDTSFLTGHIMQTVSGSNLILDVNLDADIDSEMRITLLNHGALGAGDVLV